MSRQVLIRDPRPRRASGGRGVQYDKDYVCIDNRYGGPRCISTNKVCDVDWVRGTTPGPCYALDAAKKPLFVPSQGVKRQATDRLGKLNLDYAEDPTYGFFGSQDQVRRHRAYADSLYEKCLDVTVLRLRAAVVQAGILTSAQVASMTKNDLAAICVENGLRGNIPPSDEEAQAIIGSTAYVPIGNRIGQSAYRARDTLPSPAARTRPPMLPGRTQQTGMNTDDIIDSIVNEQARRPVPPPRPPPPRRRHQNVGVQTDPMGGLSPLRQLSPRARALSPPRPPPPRRSSSPFKGNRGVQTDNNKLRRSPQLPRRQRSPSHPRRRSPVIQRNSRSLVRRSQRSRSPSPFGDTISINVQEPGGPSTSYSCSKSSSRASLGSDDFEDIFGGKQ